MPTLHRITAVPARTPHAPVVHATLPDQLAFELALRRISDVAVVDGLLYHPLPEDYAFLRTSAHVHVQGMFFEADRDALAVFLGPSMRPLREFSLLPDCTVTGQAGGRAGVWALYLKRPTHLTLQGTDLLSPAHQPAMDVRMFGRTERCTVFPVPGLPGVDLDLYIQGRPDPQLDTFLHRAEWLGHPQPVLPAS
jgi:hypothetical protein